MKGKIKFNFKVGKRNYNFVLTRNITIIHDKSATGKTSLIRDLHLYKRQAVSLRSSKRFSLESDGYKVELLDDERWEDVSNRYEVYKDTIFVIDEYSTFITLNEFSEFVAKTGSYFIIITRRPLSNLAYSVNSVFTLGFDKDTGVYSFVPRYMDECSDLSKGFYIGDIETLNPDLIIVEDSNSGFQFFKSLGYPCLSACGNTNVKNSIESNLNYNLLVIADGAAFGCSMYDIFETYKDSNIHLYLPESFEYLLLNSKIFTSNELTDKLKHTYNYVEYLEHISWERYYTHLILELSENTAMSYTKKHLNLRYLKEKNVCKILHENNLCKLCSKFDICDNKVYISNDISKLKVKPLELVKPNS